MLPNTTDGNPNAGAGEAGSPNQPTSPVGGQLSQSDIEAMETKITERVRRELQKGNDKQIRNEVSRILELNKKGYDGEQIEERLILDQIIAERKNPNLAQNSGTVSSEPRSDVSKVFQLSGLDPASPEATALAAKNLPFEQALVEASKMAAIKGSASLSSPNPPLTGGTSDELNVEELTQKYVEELKGAAGKGNQEGNKIREKYRNLKVPVDSVTFKYS